MLEFGVPRGLARPAWELWVRIGLPAAGMAISPGWREVGSFSASIGGSTGRTIFPLCGARPGSKACSRGG